MQPAGDLPIDLITVGTMGSTMTGGVADTIQGNHWDVNQIDAAIANNQLIYWTRAQRDEYERTGNLNYIAPRRSITTYDQIYLNLVLQGFRDPNYPCGLCYWDDPSGRFVWVEVLGDGDEILLADILNIMIGFLNRDVELLQLYWTSCLYDQYWTGNTFQVAFNPTMRTQTTSAIRQTSSHH